MDPRMLAYFGEFVTESRKQLIEQVLTRRTKALTVVLENIYQTQNASAVIRTCDCFGVQDLHIIENDNQFTINPNVVHGASKWINMYHHNSGEENTIDCIKSLRAKGYTIVATTPNEDAMSVFDYCFDKPIAVLFGTEKTGLTKNAFKMADHHLTIPMLGFTESLNLSVSVSLVVSILREKMEAKGVDWWLTPEEKNDLRLKWYKHSVSRADILERQFMKNLRD